MAESALVRLRDEAEAKTREAAEQTDELRTEVDGLGATLEALTSEGAALRRTLREVESSLEKERRQKADLETRLAGARAYSERIGQDLAEIQGRFGYRVGRLMRRMTFRKDSRGPDGDNLATLPAPPDDGD